MGQFFNYDNAKNRHQICAIPVENEKGELLGFRPHVIRSDAKKGGIAETISDRFPALKWKVFSSEKICREYASDFFKDLHRTETNFQRMNNSIATGETN